MRFLQIEADSEAWDGCMQSTLERIARGDVHPSGSHSGRWHALLPQAEFTAFRTALAPYLRFFGNDAEVVSFAADVSTQWRKEASLTLKPVSSGGASLPPLPTKEEVLADQLASVRKRAAAVGASEAITRAQEAAKMRKAERARERNRQARWNDPAGNDKPATP